jgi:predicted CXXCH cytochrome family protein
MKPTIAVVFAIPALALPAPALLALALLAPAALAQQQQQSVINSRHNLSASGPGAIRASSEQEVCIFCHTPHNAAPVQPLWNRNAPANGYTVYSSSSLQAKPGQPTGSSKLCLSCHDGTIALGSVLSRDQPIAMAGGVTTLPPGHANLGTDLSDDHPVSFRYDLSLSTRNPKLKPPTGLPPAVHTDRNQEMQCTTCHEPHDNSFGQFLVMDNRNSQLCNACHRPGTTDVAGGHDQCASCHTPHSAPSKTFLLKGPTVADTCTACHGGQPGPAQGQNILADLNKPSRHDTNSPVDQPNHAPTDVSCNDCHEPHTILAQTASAPVISPKLGAIDGVNSAGAAVPRAQYQYEVCFKCHADRPAVQPRISRQIVQNNTRLEFAPSAVSFHPVQAAGKNSFVPSLRPGLTTASLMYCSSCHSSDASKTAGGVGPNGPHGSGQPPLLIARYDTADNTSESDTAYALCYSCHDRASILSDQSFPHRRHVVDSQTPCSVCHDAHGVSSSQGTTTRNAHLMNFDTTVVQADPVTGRIEYNSQGIAQGTCYMNCHGKPHSNLGYSRGTTIQGVGTQGVRRAPVRR